MVEVQRTTVCAVLAGCHREEQLRNRPPKGVGKKKRKSKKTFCQISKFSLFLRTKKSEQICTAWLQQVSSNDISGMIYAISGKENINLG